MRFDKGHKEDAKAYPGRRFPLHTKKMGSQVPVSLGLWPKPA